MADTYHVTSEVGSPAVDANTILAPTSSSDIQDNSAFFALYNQRTSAKVVRVKRLLLHNSTGSASTQGGAPEVLLQRISDMSDGARSTIKKFDSTVSALSSKIAVVAYPSVTASGDPFRAGPAGTYRTTPAVAPVMSRMVPGGGVFGRLDTTSLYSRRDTVLQAIVIREGEGIALVSKAGNPNGWQATIPGYLCVTLCLSVGGETFWVEELLPLKIHAGNNADNTDFDPIIGIFNQTGSGAVVTLAFVDVYDAHQNNNQAQWPSVSVGMISHAYGGVSLPTIRPDSNAPALPSDVLVMRDPGVIQIAPDSLMGRRKSTIGDSVFRRVLKWYDVPMGPGTGTPVPSLGRHFRDGRVLEGLGGEQVLRAGRGLGLFLNLPSTPTFGAWMLDLTFTVE